MKKPETMMDIMAMLTNITMCLDGEGIERTMKSKETMEQIAGALKECIAESIDVLSKDLGCPPYEVIEQMADVAEKITDEIKFMCLFRKTTA